MAIRSSVRLRTFNFSVSIFIMLWLRGGSTKGLRLVHVDGTKDKDNSRLIDLENKNFGRLRTSDVPTVNTLGISGALTPVCLSFVLSTCGI